MKITDRAAGRFLRHQAALVWLCAGALLARLPAAELEIHAAAEVSKVVAPDAKLVKLAGGLKFTEGPVWRVEAGG